MMDFRTQPKAKPVDPTKVEPFKVVQSRTRSYGYTVQAPLETMWAIGPGHTTGWFRRKRDAQAVCDASNKALLSGQYKLVAVDDHELRAWLEAERNEREYANAIGL